MTLHPDNIPLTSHESNDPNRGRIVYMEPPVRFDWIGVGMVAALFSLSAALQGLAALLFAHALKVVG